MNHGSWTSKKSICAIHTTHFRDLLAQDDCSVFSHFDPIIAIEIKQKLTLRSIWETKLQEMV